MEKVTLQHVLDLACHNGDFFKRLVRDTRGTLITSGYELTEDDLCELKCLVKHGRITISASQLVDICSVLAGQTVSELKSIPIMAAPTPPKPIPPWVMPP